MIRIRAVCLLALFLTACGEKATVDTPTSPTVLPSEVGYTAIGASDAIGVGASVLCAPRAACPNGTGYVPLIVRGLTNNSRRVTLTNLGIPGAVIGPDLQALGNRFGRNIIGNFLQHELPDVPANSNVVTVFAGGNDTNAIAAALSGGAGGSNPSQFVADQIQVFGRDYGTLIQGIRQRAPSARIVVANLPNFAGIPLTATSSPVQRQFVQQISVGMSVSVINPLATQGIAVVDLLCEARSYETARFSSDGFHPNDAGYATLAELYVAAITSTTYPAPRSNCDQMNLVSSVTSSSTAASFLPAPRL